MEVGDYHINVHVLFESKNQVLEKHYKVEDIPIADTQD